MHLIFVNIVEEKETVSNFNPPPPLPIQLPYLQGRCRVYILHYMCGTFMTCNFKNNNTAHVQTFQAFYRDNTVVHCLVSRYQCLNILQDMAQIRYPCHFSRIADKFRKQGSLENFPQGTTPQNLRNNQCLKNTKSSYTFRSTKSWFLPGVPCDNRSLCIMGDSAFQRAQRIVERGKNSRWRPKREAAELNEYYRN